MRGTAPANTGEKLMREMMSLSMNNATNQTATP